jgi:hypothetical protein
VFLGEECFTCICLFACKIAKCKKARGKEFFLRDNGGTIANPLSRIFFIAMPFYFIYKLSVKTEQKRIFFYTFAREKNK